MPLIKSSPLASENDSLSDAERQLILKKRMRPRDAASLLLVDRSGSDMRVLMGRRNQKLVFMPGKFVFPGGRADPVDGSIAAASELQPSDQSKLFAGMGSKATARRARALALCAIRETFEETGLRLSLTATTNATNHAHHPDWSDFLQDGELPALAPLRYFARAITPPGNVRRFDTRFFMSFRDCLPDLAQQQLRPSGELELLDWVPFSKALELDIPRITRAILKHAQSLLPQSLLNDTNTDLPASIPVIQYSARHGRTIREVI